MVIPASHTEFCLKAKCSFHPEFRESRMQGPPPVADLTTTKLAQRIPSPTTLATIGLTTLGITFARLPNSKGMIAF